MFLRFGCTRRYEDNKNMVLETRTKKFFGTSLRPVALDQGNGPFLGVRLVGVQLESLGIRIVREVHAMEVFRTASWPAWATASRVFAAV